MLTPHRRTYFDYSPSDDPGEPPASAASSPAPTPTPSTPPDARGGARPVLGAQCQLWTEYMPTPRGVEYMAFPRLCAFAEVAWGTAGDYPDFLGGSRRTWPAWRREASTSARQPIAEPARPARPALTEWREASTPAARPIGLEDTSRRKA